MHPGMSVNSADMVGTNLLIRQFLNRWYEYKIKLPADVIANCAASTLNFRRDFFGDEITECKFSEEKLK